MTKLLIDVGGDACFKIITERADNGAAVIEFINIDNKRLDSLWTEVAKNISKAHATWYNQWDKIGPFLKILGFKFSF